MKHWIPLAIGVALLVAADTRADDDAKLQGTWRMVRGERDGKPVPPDAVRTATLTMEGNMHTVRVGEDSYIGTQKLDPSTQPKSIDVTDSEGRFKGQTLKGIYRVEGDELTVCFAKPGEQRPTKFTTRSGTGSLMDVWRREKR
jgi:uncharacterized protein (TIGR03067 family)